MAPVARAQHSTAVYSCAPQGHKGVAAHTQAGTVEGTTGGRGEQRGDQAGENRRQDLTFNNDAGAHIEEKEKEKEKEIGINKEFNNGVVNLTRLIWITDYRSLFHYKALAGLNLRARDDWDW
jgi:hypothetical protein